MIKELIKIANELDSRGLVREADVVDVFLKKAYSPSNAWRDAQGLAADVTDSAAEAAGAAREILYDTPKRQWSKGVGQTLRAAGEEASEVASEAAQVAFNAIINNPDWVEWASIGTKLGAGIAIAFPEPASTASGVAVMKASSFLDVIAAIGFAKEGRNIEAFFSLVASVAFIPGGAMYKIFIALRNLRKGKKTILLIKAAPAIFVGAMTPVLDALINGVEAATSQAASIAESYNSSKEATLWSGDTLTGGVVNAPIGIVDENDIANKIRSGAKEVLDELNSWKPIMV